jgi:hypothetical protein
MMRVRLVCAFIAVLSYTVQKFISTKGINPIIYRSFVKFHEGVNLKQVLK